MAHGAFVAARVGWDAFERDGVDDGVIAGTGEERGESFFLAESRENLRASHREGCLQRSRLAGLGEYIRNFDRLVFSSVSGVRLVFPEGNNRRPSGAGHRFGDELSSGDVRPGFLDFIFVISVVHRLSWWLLLLRSLLMDV